MTTLRTSIAFDLAAKFTSALDLQTGSAPLNLSRSFSWGDGTAAESANRVWSDRRTLAASATEDLDLAGVLTDAFGTAITFAKVRALIVAASSGNTNNVLLGGVSAGLSTIIQPAATGIVVVRPGGLVAFIAPDTTGYAVTATTADLLHVANSAGSTSVTYDIAIVGTA